MNLQIIKTKTKKNGKNLFIHRIDKWSTKTDYNIIFDASKYERYDEMETDKKHRDWEWKWKWMSLQMKNQLENALFYCNWT